MAFEETKEKFIKLLRDIKSEKERNEFLKWIHVNWNIDSLLDEDLDCVKILKSIADEIRSVVPFEAILPSEKISLPVCGPNSDCKLQTTIHVDEFLYNDDYVEKLIENGLLSRYYCSDCYGRNVKLLNFISHSMSISRIQYLFRCLLPPLKNETILDVGSRLGAVLYGAYLNTCSQKIIGVEINPELCKIQSDVIKKFYFEDRIQVICNSINNEIELLSSSDVIILNNVFEFFTAVEDTIYSWCLLAKKIKVGCILVTVPHLKDTFQHIKIGFDWEDWVEELKEYQTGELSCDFEELQTHQESMKHYKVKKQINLD